MVATIDGRALVEKQSTGGYLPVDVTSPEVAQMADVASQYLASRPLTSSYQFVEVVKVESQPVAGVNYKLTIKFTDKSVNEPFNCEVIVFNQPWTNTTKVKQFLCPASAHSASGDASARSSSNAARPGYSPVETDDVEVKKMAEVATAALSSGSTSGPYKMVEIVKAETQTDDGQHYKMTIKFTDDGDNGAFNCDVVVLSEPLKKTIHVTQSVCPTKKPANVINPPGMLIVF